MFEIIKEEIKTIEGVRNMFTDHLYYAYKWVEEGTLEVSDKVFTELVNQMCLRGL